MNPRHVLGASIKGLPEHIEESRVPERIARYAQTFGSTDNVAYVWIKALGIFWAHEGKHRVAFMRPMINRLLRPGCGKRPIHRQSDWW